MNSIGDRPRVVFDCNVLLQAVSNEFGPAVRAIKLLEQNRIEVFLSRAVLKELRKVFQYPSVREKFPGLNETSFEMFVRKLSFRGNLVRRVPHAFDYPRAIQDEPYIDLAAAARANFLVSRDTDLLSLATDRSAHAKQFRQRFPWLRVVNPVVFLSLVDPGKGSTT